MITQQAARRRRGRAIRKRRRLKVAPPSPALLTALQAVIDHIRRAWVRIQNAFRFVRCMFAVSPSRPLLHNGRKS